MGRVIAVCYDRGSYLEGVVMKLARLMPLVLLIASCDDSVDSSYRTGLLAADDLTAVRISASEPGVVMVTLLLRNDTTTTVNNVSSVGWRAGETTALFDLFASGVMECVPADPWDVAPAAVDEVRMRLDLRADPVILDLGCSFDPALPGFDALTARKYTAPRTGSAPPGDFHGPLELELKATLDADCTPDDCPVHALVRASTMIASP